MRNSLKFVSPLLAIFVIVLSITLLFSNTALADVGVTYKNFGVTEKEYNTTDDWDQIVKNVFGPDYRVADWDNLVSYYNSGGDLKDLFEGLGICSTEYNNGEFVTRSGDRTYGSTRYYFVSWQNHNLPGGWLAHDNIDNYLISLGSWTIPHKIMAIKITKSTISNVAQPTYTKQPQPTSTESPQPTPTEQSPTASVNLYGEKTNVVKGEDIQLKLSAVNLITKPTMHVQVILIPPSGMSVSSSEFSMSGAGQYTSRYDLEPGQGKDIEVKIAANQVGNFDVKGTVVYYFGSNKEDSEYQQLDLPIQVSDDSQAGTSTLTQTQTADESTKQPHGITLNIPGFGVSSLVFIIIVVFFLRRK